MRTIVVNGVSFHWKLTRRKAKELGILGPGHGDSAVLVLQNFRDDWDGAEAFVIAGCQDEDKERVRLATQDWDRDDFDSFLEQAFSKTKASPEDLPVQ